MAQMGKTLAGYAAMGVGGLLLVRGRFDLAVPLLVFGAGLAGWMPGLPGLPGSLFGRTRPTPGRRSRVVSRLIEMELDHDSGTLHGRVVAGRLAGRSLDELAEPDLRVLWGEAQADPDARSLLEAYLDRRAPGWREHFQQDATAGAGERAGRSQAMTKEEAYQILGVEPGASADVIRQAHRALMKKLHPDQGGSTYLASRVNEARDLLLNTHH
jgi:hypothetical protein